MTSAGISLRAPKSRPPAHSSLRRDPITVAVALAALVAFACVGLSMRLSATTAPYAAQLALVHRAEQRIALSHLWLEEAIAGDPHVDFQADVVTRIEDTARVLDLLIEGGKTAENVDLPRLAEPTLRLAVQQARSELATWRHLTGQRWLSRVNLGSIGGELDQQYDAHFNRFAERLDAVGYALSLLTAESQTQSERLSLVSMGILLVTFLGVLMLTRRYQSRLETERRLLEQRVTERTEALSKEKLLAESANRAKDAFLANMSHEIRTPMTAVIGMTNLLRTTRLDHQQREYVETALTSAEQLLSLINDILDYSKLEAGAIDLESAPFVLSECVEDALETGGHGAASKGLELVADIDGRVPSTVVGDMHRLRQVLVNLVGNAVKFTSKGEVIVRVTAEPLAAPRVRLQFEVIDTGIGIPEDRRDRLFKTFSQLDSSTTRKYGGTGLGLAITLQLVQAMQGEVSVASRVGHGSTFKLLLDLDTAPGAIPLARENARLQQKRMLVVDDNANNRKLLSRLLTSWGVHVDTAESGFAALERLRRRNYDAVLLDYHMPELDGITTARSIRHELNLESLPLVLLSSLGASSDVELINATLTKPIREQRLFDCLLSILGHDTHAERASVVPLGTRNPLAILVAEDQPINRTLILAFLRRLGYPDVDIAADGRAAIEACRSRRYDLVLMDMQMPELDGLEATRQILAENAAGHAPRIVAMTANVFDEDREACRKAGMVGFLAKPLTEDELAAQIEQTLARPPGSVPEPEESGAVRRGKQNGDGPKVDPLPTSMLDPLTLADLRELGLLPELAQRAQVLRAGPFQDLRKAHSSADVRRFAEIAHALKGTTGTLGALSLSSQFSIVCRLAQQGALPPYTTVAQLGAELDRLCVELGRAANG
jgi:signal transduction histidine kinase/DNA-binding response OmpR family regulator